MKRVAPIALETGQDAIVLGPPSRPVGPGQEAHSVRCPGLELERDEPWCRQQTHEQRAAGVDVGLHGGDRRRAQSGGR